MRGPPLDQRGAIAGLGGEGFVRGGVTDRGRAHRGAIAIAIAVAVAVAVTAVAVTAVQVSAVAGGDGHRRRYPLGGPTLPADKPDQTDPKNPRPDDVELLFDGERPKVAERRGRPEPGEIRHVLERQPPIADVEGCRSHVTSQRPQLGRAGDGHPDRDGGQHYEQRRQQPTGPTGQKSRSFRPPLDSQLPRRRSVIK